MICTLPLDQLGKQRTGQCDEAGHVRVDDVLDPAPSRFREADRWAVREAGVVEQQVDVVPRWRQVRARTVDRTSMSRMSTPRAGRHHRALPESRFQPIAPSPGADHVTSRPGKPNLRADASPKPAVAPVMRIVFIAFSSCSSSYAPRLLRAHPAKRQVPSATCNKIWLVRLEKAGGAPREGVGSPICGELICADSGQVDEPLGASSVTKRCCQCGKRDSVRIDWRIRKQRLHSTAS